MINKQINPPSINLYGNHTVHVQVIDHIMISKKLCFINEPKILPNIEPYTIFYNLKKIKENIDTNNSINKKHKLNIWKKRELEDISDHLPVKAVIEFC